MPAQKNKNIILIDLLRFFAAFSVYWYHQHLGVVLSKLSGIALLSKTDLIGATYAVPLFFLISGFCIHLANQKYLKANDVLPLKIYYWKRFWRIYPPYLIALLFSVIVNVLLRKENVPTTDYIIHVFALQSFFAGSFNSINLVLWTISVEIFFYIVYPIFYFIRNKYSINKALLASFFISSLSIIVLTNKEEISLPQRFFFLNLWFAWCFGAWLCETFLFSRKTYSDKKLIAGSAIIFLLFFLLKSISWHNDFLVKDSLNVIVFGPILIWLLRFEEIFHKNKKLLAIPIALGLSSYSLYLIHEPLITARNYFIDRYAAPGVRQILMIATIPLILVLAYINYRLFERPFMNFASRKKKLEGKRREVILKHEIE